VDQGSKTSATESIPIVALGEAVLVHGAPTEAHISEMTALARAEQEQIKRKMRRTMRIFRQSQKKAA